ncbi:lycopene cyclase domain-containing protein [Cellulomonas sp. KRMCY2]|uniref:lycopene cyclase domain-containing protein n=1 Tax=Cellulomonas sp. KRMCY2 TaxID=1304865 RepID=UPI00045E69ED|nr:lycopene cyclase domain-containing protein [Cellulomonas sp. KRMCY2]
MTYLYLAMVFIGLATTVALVARWRTGGPSVTAIALSVVVLAATTAVFDNLMISAELFGFAEEHLIGAFVGRAPVEDVSYPVAGALLLPALWHLLAGRERDRAEGRAEPDPAEDGRSTHAPSGGDR